MSEAGPRIDIAELERLVKGARNDGAGSVELSVFCVIDEALPALLRVVRAAKAFQAAERNAIMAAVMTAHSGDPFDAEGFAVKERDARTALYDALNAFYFGEDELA